MARNVMFWDGPFDGSLTAGESGTELARYSLDQFKAHGFFSLQAIVTGSGSLTITYEVTNAPTGTDESDIVWAAGDSAIITALTVGNTMVTFPDTGELIFGKQIRLLGTEVTTTDGLNYRLWPNVQ